MDSQMMDVTGNGEGSQEVHEGLTQATSAGEESAGEAPAPEALAAMATEEGRSAAEVEWLEQISKHLLRSRDRSGISLRGSALPLAEISAGP